MQRVCVFGLGEAGSLVASDLISAGLDVFAYDPAPVATPVGVQRVGSPQAAVREAQAVLAFTSAADATQALEQALDVIPADALYADFSTASAGLKRELDDKAATRSLAFVDVALLAVVPGKGLRTPSAVSGTGAEQFAAAFSALGMPVEYLGPQAGQAATRKLLRSVFMKGLAAVMIEAMRGAEQAGLSEWLWDNLSQEIAHADASLLHRFVTGTELHAERRLHEMQAASELLRELQLEPLMTDATVANLQRVLEQGLPQIPDNLTN